MSRPVQENRRKVAAVAVAGLVALAIQPLAAAPAAASTGAGGAVSVTYTSYNVDEGSHRLSPQPDKTLTPMSNSSAMTINVDPSVSYQSYEGWGSSLEDATIYHLQRLSSTSRESALQALVSRANGNNMNLWRTTIGCADFCRTAKTTGFWTYADNNGVADPTLSSFSIARDISDGKIAIMQRMRQINPELRFYASLWSPPAWMKTNNSITGPEGYFGHCKTDGTEPRVQHGNTGPHHTGSSNDYYPVLADYYVKYVQAYAAQGIPIYAVTLQNEPDIQMPYPTTCFTPGQMQDFAKILKQKFTAAGITSKIWGMDANLTGDTFKYTDALLGDAATNPAVDGIAFHNYDNTTMWQPNAVAAQYPTKTQHMTEITQGANKLIEFFRGGVSSYSGWATMFEYSMCNAVDDTTNDIVLCNAGPSWWMDRKVSTTDPDADTPSLISPRAGDPTQYDLNGWYYIWGQFSRSIQLGAKRIDSTDRMGTISNVAFQNPDGTVVIVVANRPDATGLPESNPARFNTTQLNTAAAPIRIATPDGEFTDTIPGDTIATYVYTPTTGNAISKAGWSASATNTWDAFTPAQAIDGNPRTRWMSGVDQSSGQSFTLDLGASRTFDQISLNQIAFPTDSPGSYTVQTSPDGTTWSGTVSYGNGTSSFTNISFAPATARYIRINLTAAAGKWWTIGDVSVYNSQAGLLPKNAGAATASLTGSGTSAAAAWDGTAGTRWTTGAAQASGQWLRLDLGATRTFTALELDAGVWSGDYPRGYTIHVSNDGVTWGSAVATGSGTSHITHIATGTRSARYVRVQLTAASSTNWWSVAEARVYNGARSTTTGVTWSSLSHTGWTASASAASASAGLGIDQWLDSRWQSGQAQSNNEWYEIDLGAARTFKGVQLIQTGGPDNGGGDYPRGYEVYTSNDKVTWTKVAAGDGYGVVNALFASRTARYISIHNTGTDASHWWSVGMVNVLTD
ncbi:discoidin domain-containing protein [Microbacterium atlanticum]|uniref:discoidin domain-containing protein n=1 Tax=Microbacterium atlanticum TaxID=2782168 RepID=UPI001888233B|nr:discoidin domain-containing protein [Microbacterium atlanticum]